MYSMEVPVATIANPTTAKTINPALNHELSQPVF
jgi:hypothetical protein